MMGDGQDGLEPDGLAVVAGCHAAVALGSGYAVFDAMSCPLGVPGRTLAGVRCGCLYLCDGRSDAQAGRLVGPWVFRGWPDAGDRGRIVCLDSGFRPRAILDQTNTTGDDRSDLLIRGGMFLDSRPRVRTKMDSVK